MQSNVCNRGTGRATYVEGGTELGLERPDEALGLWREGLREERDAAHRGAVVLLLHDGRSH